METIGFIGVGTIGEPMARQVLRAGYRLVVHDLRREATERLVAEGAQWADSPASVAERSPLTITSLPTPAVVESVVTGRRGLLEGAPRGHVHVDMTTNSWEVAHRMAAVESARGISYLDAPVSGGRFLAEEGKLTIMASGDATAFETARPVLEAMGEKVFHLSESVGTGTLVKLTNNAIFLASGLVTQECLVLVAKAGLDVDRVVEVLRASSASAYIGLVDLFRTRDFENAFFTLDLATKDLALALESASGLEVDMAVTRAAHGVYQRSQAQGLGREVFFATLKAIEAASASEVPKAKGKA